MLHILVLVEFWWILSLLLLVWLSWYDALVIIVSIIDARLHMHSIRHISSHRRISSRIILMGIIQWILITSHAWSKHILRSLFWKESVFCIFTKRSWFSFILGLSLVLWLALKAWSSINNQEEDFVIVNACWNILVILNKLIFGYFNIIFGCS